MNEIKLPPITEDDEKLLHYNPNTSDLVDFVKAYAEEAVRLNQVGIPAGWKLVPIEPTDAMAAAAIGASLADKDSINGLPQYRAMLSAAPSHPIAAQETRDTVAPVDDLVRSALQFYANREHIQFDQTGLVKEPYVEQGSFAAKALAALSSAPSEPAKGHEVSVDVSTGDSDAGNRIYARLTGESNGGVWLAEETGRNFPAPSGQTAEEYLRNKYGAYRGHHAWRDIEEAFNAGKVSAPSEQDKADAAELWQALNDLSFECFELFNTKAPSAGTYNRTFDVMQKHRDRYAAIAAQEKGGAS